MAVASSDDYKVRLIDLADQVARAGVPGAGVHGIASNGDLYLERFRVAYQHLATSVETRYDFRKDGKLPIAEEE